MASVIETKINRLASAKAAIKAAIEGKGVTVPDATLLDGMAALIESIQAGGGGGGKIAFTEITPASNTLNLTFNHNLGEKPNFIVWASNVSYNAYIRAHLFGLCFDLQEQDISWIYIMFKWTNSSTPQNTISIGKSVGKLSYNSSGYGVISCDENQITFGSNGTNIVNFLSGKSVVVITGVIQ